MEQFDALLAQTIDSSLELKSTLFGCQYSEVLLSLIYSLVVGIPNFFQLRIPPSMSNTLKPNFCIFIQA